MCEDLRYTSMSRQLKDQLVGVMISVQLKRASHGLRHMARVLEVCEFTQNSKACCGLWLFQFLLRLPATMDLSRPPIF